MEMQQAATPQKRSFAKRMGVALIWFFAIMLVLTYVSRALGESLKAEVDTGYLSASTLNQSLEGTGGWTVGETQFFSLSSARRVTAVYVQAGQTVAAGDPLFAYDVSDVTWSAYVSDRARNNAEKAVAAAEKALETAEDAAAAARTLDSVRQALAYAEFAYAEAYAIQHGGVVPATFSGTLVRCDLAVGKSPAAGTAAIEIAPGGVRFTLTVAEQEAERIAVGDRVILYDNGTEETERLTVASLAPADAEGRVSAVCEGDGGIARRNGQKQAWRIEKQSQKYQTCVPVAALRQSGPNTYYVLVLTEKDTILGTQLIARQVNVTLLGHDSVRAAVEGAISERDLLITTSTKELKDGDHVALRDA